MKKSVLLLMSICQSIICFGQISIEECYRLAKENYPLVKRYDLIGQSENYDLKNASKSYLPQFSLSAKATYQTDVTSIPITIPGYDIPVLSKDQYQVLAEVTQVIWDGGTTKASKDALRAQGDADRAQYEVDMYALKERVNNMFFGILLLDEQIRLNALYLENLRVNYERICSYVDNGVANQADLDAVKAEQLSAGQDSVQLKTNREAYVQMLSAFIGKPVQKDEKFIKPEVLHEPVADGTVNRPELTLYDAMQQQMETQRRSINASNMPQLGLFLQGGYGKPGLNMLQDKFKLFAIGGIRFSWNFGNYYTRRNKLRNIDVGVRQIEVQRETFLFNNNLQRIQLAGEYGKYRQIMADDDEIIRMRSNIVKASEAKLENGVLSATDLVRDMISEQNAKVNKAVHEVELMQTIYEIKNLTNN